MPALNAVPHLGHSLIMISHFKNFIWGFCASAWNKIPRSELARYLFPQPGMRVWMSPLERFLLLEILQLFQRSRFFSYHVSLLSRMAYVICICICRALMSICYYAKSQATSARALDRPTSDRAPYLFRAHIFILLFPSPFVYYPSFDWNFALYPSGE